MVQAEIPLTDRICPHVKCSPNQRSADLSPLQRPFFSQCKLAEVGRLAGGIDYMRAGCASGCVSTFNIWNRLESHGIACSKHALHSLEEKCEQFHRPSSSAGAGSRHRGRRTAHAARKSEKGKQNREVNRSHLRSGTARQHTPETEEAAASGGVDGLATRTPRAARAAGPRTAAHHPEGESSG